MAHWLRYLRLDPRAFAELRQRRRRAATAGVLLVDWGIDHAWGCEFERSLMGRVEAPVPGPDPSADPGDR